jgi:hypothetical protein
MAKSILVVTHPNTDITRKIPEWLPHTVAREAYYATRASVVMELGIKFGLSGEIAELYSRMLAEIFTDEAVYLVGIYRIATEFSLRVYYNKAMSREEKRQATERLSRILQNFAEPGNYTG